MDRRRWTGEKRKTRRPTTHITIRLLVGAGFDQQPHTVRVASLSGIHQRRPSELRVECTAKTQRHRNCIQSKTRLIGRRSVNEPKTQRSSQAHNTCAYEAANWAKKQYRYVRTHSNLMQYEKVRKKILEPKTDTPKQERTRKQKTRLPDKKYHDRKHTRELLQGRDKWQNTTFVVSWLQHHAIKHALSTSKQNTKLRTQSLYSVSAPSANSAMTSSARPVVAASSNWSHRISANLSIWQ